MTYFVIVGDEAWTADDWQRRVDKTQAGRSLYQARKAGATLQPGRPRRALASLHALRCEGPTRATGCSCRKIPFYGEPA